jgi:hypothetical protein
MVGGGGAAVLMRRGNRPLSAEAAELLGLLGLQGSKMEVAENVIVSRSCAAVVDTVGLLEVVSRTNSKTPENQLRRAVRSCRAA